MPTSRRVLVLLGLCCASVRCGDMILGAHNAGMNRGGLAGWDGLWWGQDSYAGFLCNHYYDITGLLDIGLRSFEVDTYWTLDDDGSPNTLGRLDDLLGDVGFGPSLISVISVFVDLIGLGTRLKFAREDRRPIIAHSVPALGFTYLEDFLFAMKAWADANPEEAVYLRFNHRSAAGSHFDDADATALEELAIATLGDTGTFLGYAEPGWPSAAGVHMWMSTKIANVPYDNSIARAGLIGGSRVYAAEDNTYENIRQTLGDAPLLVANSDFWTAEQVAQVKAAIAAESG